MKGSELEISYLFIFWTEMVIDETNTWIWDLQTGVQLMKWAVEAKAEETLVLTQFIVWKLPTQTRPYLFCQYDLLSGREASGRKRKAKAGSQNMSLRLKMPDMRNRRMSANRERMQSYLQTQLSFNTEYDIFSAPGAKKIISLSQIEIESRVRKFRAFCSANLMLSCWQT